MRNKHFIFSSLVSLIFLIGAAFAFYLMYNHYNNLEIREASGIVKTFGKSSGNNHQMDLKTIIHNSQKDVVQISVNTNNGEVIGSGFLYNDQGDIITNAHVVTGASTVTVKTSDAKNYTGQVIGIGDKTDVAVVRVPELAGETPIKINRSKKAEIGDKVIALGSPLGLQNTVTLGNISGLDREFTIDPFDYSDMYQISASITHGNSGGPLLDQKTGEAIAINSAGTEEGNIGFSIPLIDVMDKIESWSKNPQDISGFNGATASESNSSRMDTFAQDAEYIVNYFYESLAAHDYVTAYALLGSAWQERTSYADFRNGYLNTLDVTINDISSEITDDGDHAIVNAVIEADEQAGSGKVVTNHYKTTYTVGYENDQLKLLDGKGEKSADKKDDPSN